MKIKVCIIGAGPAGLMASINSAGNNAETVLLESNSTAGRKLLLTGSGRCNVTHSATADEIARTFGTGGRFLRFALHEFPPEKTRNFFHTRGLQSQVEPTGCVFPVTNRADDVRNILLSEAKRHGVRFIFSEKVDSVIAQSGRFTVTGGGKTILTEKVIIATGGLSYSNTGSTGDGYKFASQLGHTIISPRAALVPLVTLESWPGELAGTSLENVKIFAEVGGKKTAVTGAMIFTHNGIGGPAVLDMSRYVTDFLPAEEKPIKVIINTVSDMNEVELENRFLRQAGEHPKKTVAGVLSEIVPRRFAQVLCRQFDFNAELYASQLNRGLRMKLLRFITAMPLSIVRTRPIDEAMVTRGGVSITEIETTTMESKICPGLFFAGEIIDVDGPCGGYNLQMCFSTGALAGVSAGREK